jgi:signal transduction histidine kinase/ActR/RegA family two-component response regulator
MAHMQAGAGADGEAASVFSGGGIAGDVLRATDWAATPLGPVKAWPMSLKAVVRAILNTHQATCLFWGPDLVNLYNDGFIPILGEKHPAAMGQRARDCWSDAWPVVGGLLADVVTRGQAVLFTEMLVPIVRRGQLQDAWWNYSYSPVFDDAGAVAGVLVVATETTAEVAGRKLLEAAKLEADLARQEMHAVFMQAPLPMALLKGPDHLFTLVNEPYRALVNRDVEGMTLGEAFNDEEVGYYRPFLDRVYQTGEATVLQEALLRLPDRDGTVRDRFIDVGYHAYRLAEGSVGGVLAIIHDVTAKVGARMHQASLRAAAEAASVAKDEFLAMVSHELRTPLNAILGWSRMLVDSADARLLQRGLAVIERNASAQSKLIEDILDVSRIVTGKVVIDARRVQLSNVVHNAVESVRPAAEAKRIHVDVTLEEMNVDLIADEDRLQQVVWNLLSNAVKFTPSGGEVRVTARRESSRVSIRVDDSGVGIAPAFLPHVFERFRQHDASTTKRFAGLGLGLAIVRHLVELHGGTVEARSEGVGHGATFEVSLPIRAIEPQREGTSMPARGATASSATDRIAKDTLEGVHVLVVDDEDDARDLLVTVLQAAGASVTEAPSAAVAMAVLASSSISVIVSDIGMPSVDGYTFIERLRSEATAMRHVPALALTAFARAEDRNRAVAAGFQEHVAKPVDPVVLVKKVAALARRYIESRPQATPSIPK